MRLSTTIYNYTINKHEFTLRLPEGAKFLHFGMQDNKMKLWIEHSTNTSYFRMHKFRIYSDGRRFDLSKVQYIGTVITTDEFVWHLYEVIKESDG